MASSHGGGPRGPAASLEAALQEARAERDLALEQLANARAELHALRSAQACEGEPAPGAFVAAGAQALPLRYRLADVANGAVKGTLGPVQRRLKALLKRRSGR